MIDCAYHRNGARYYACWLGRWTASDPAGLVDGVNLYMYVRGNPVRLHDPSGKAGARPECNDQIDYNLPNQDVKALPDNPTLGGMRGNASGSFETSDSVDSLGGQSGIANGSFDPLDLSPENGTVVDPVKYSIEEIKLMSSTSKNLSDKEIRAIGKENPELSAYLKLHKGAIKKGLEILENSSNREIVSKFNSLRLNTQRAEGLPEFSFGARTGKKGVIPKEGVTVDKQKSAPIRYEDKDTFGMHSHPGETPLSNSPERGDLLHSIHNKKDLFVITPSGNIYFTTPELAENARKMTDVRTAGTYGQVYLGNIKQFLTNH